MSAAQRAWSYIELTIRSFRLELALTVGTTAVVVAAMLATAAHLSGFGVTSDCIGRWFVDSSTSTSCGTVVSDWAAANEQLGRNLLVAGAILTVITGLVLGVAVLGRELENGTAEFTWSLATSRRAWLMRRVVMALGLIVVLGGASAWAASVLEDQRTAYGLWVAAYPDADLVGWPVLLRMSAGFGLGFLLGTVIGRTLPAFLAGALAAAVLVNILGVGQGLFASPPAGAGGTTGLAVYLSSDALDVLFVDPAGHLFRKVDVLATVPSGAEPAAWIGLHYVPIPIGIAAHSYAAWQTILTAVYGGVAVLATATALFSAGRRRPY
jgi:hypothetical protein